MLIWCSREQSVHTHTRARAPCTLHTLTRSHDEVFSVLLFPIGTEHMWAYVQSTSVSPESARGAWHVYSYAARAYELQHSVKVERLFQSVAAWATPPNTPPLMNLIADGMHEPASTPPPTPPLLPALERWADAGVCLKCRVDRLCVCVCVWGGGRWG